MVAAVVGMGPSLVLTETKPSSAWWPWRGHLLCRTIVSWWWIPTIGRCMLQLGWPLFALWRPAAVADALAEVDVVVAGAVVVLVVVVAAAVAAVAVAATGGVLAADADSERNSSPWAKERRLRQVRNSPAMPAIMLHVEAHNP